MLNYQKRRPVMYPLLACSMIALTLSLNGPCFGSCRTDQGISVVDEVLELCRVGNWESVRMKVKGSKDYRIRILSAASCTVSFP